MQSASERQATQRPAVVSQTWEVLQSSEFVQGVKATQLRATQSLFIGQSALLTQSTHWAMDGSHTLPSEQSRLFWQLGGVPESGVLCFPPPQAMGAPAATTTTKKPIRERRPLALTRPKEVTSWKFRKTPDACTLLAILSRQYSAGRPEALPPASAPFHRRRTSAIGDAGHARREPAREVRDNTTFRDHGWRGTRTRRSEMLDRLRWGLMVAVVVVLAPAGGALAQQRNSCGCYRSDTGSCYCDKKAACGCPGECEPKGCEEARDRALQREIEAETRKAQQAGGARASGQDEGEAEATAPRHVRAPRPAARPAAEARKLTPAQTKQLAKLLDAYLGAEPDARSKSVDDLRKQLGATP
jgi:hypothetical protein